MATAGERAPEKAIREGRVELVLLNADGTADSYGFVVRRRTEGKYLVELTRDRDRWCVVAAGGDQILVAEFHDAGGEERDAARMFSQVTERQIDGALRSPHN